MSGVFNDEDEGLRVPCVRSLHPHILGSIFFQLDEGDLRQLRLVNKEFCAAATAALRSLRPLKCDALIPRFPGLQAIDFWAVPQDAWPEKEASLAYLENAKGITSLKFGSSCNITATDAAAIATLTSLRSLQVQDTRLNNNAMRCWSTLSGLTLLSLLGCRNLDETGLKVLGSLRKLEIVELGFTGVNDNVLVELGKLPLLRELDISSCDSFTEEGLAALAAAPFLRTLLLPACWHLDDEMLCTLCRSIPNLECLSLFEAGEGVSDTGLGYLTALTSLTGLDLGYSCWAHTAAGLEQVLKTLPRLQMLNIGGAEGVCDDVLRTVASTLTALTMLDISECQKISTQGLREMAKLPALVELHLGWNTKLESKALATLPPSLTHLDLSYCSQLSLGSLDPGSLPNIQHLLIRRSAMLDDTGLASLVVAAPKLRFLDISYCAGITSSGLKCLSSLTELSSLIISGCQSAATVLGLGYLAAVPALTTLEGCNIPRLDDGCMQAVSFVRQLKHLCLRGCPRISDHGVMALVRMPRLETLKVDGRNVTQSAIDKLHAKLPRLRRVQLICRDSATYEFYESLGLQLFPNHY